MTLLEFVSCNPTTAPYVFWEGSRGISGSAHLVCVTTPCPAWRRARCTDGAAEGATLCCRSAVPLTSTVVAARPSYCPRQSLCVCVYVYACVFCLFVCLTLWLSRLSSVDCQLKFKTGLALLLTHVHMWSQWNLWHSCRGALIISLLNLTGRTITNVKCFQFPHLNEYQFGLVVFIGVLHS